jgi:hypothetical protein
MTKHHKAMPRGGQCRRIPLDKVAATFAAVPLMAAETGLNAEHLAHVEGWMSTLVAGAIGATLAAAAALPIAERAMTRGYWLKASGLTAFFLIMMAFSFTTSVGRVGAKADSDAVGARGHNARLELASQAYAAAVATQAAECKGGRGPRCRDAEKAVAASRIALQAAPAAKAEASMETRLAAATGLSIEAVALYQPLLFPLALQLGGFFFLAYGLAPQRETRSEPARPVEAPAPAKTPAKKQAKKQAAAKPATASRKKLKALPRLPLLLPAGVAAFDSRAAMHAHK